MMRPILIDSHCHIDGKEFDPDRGAVLERARAAGVSPLVVVGTGPTVAEVRRALELALGEPDIWAAVGVHPHDAARFSEPDWEELATLAQNPRTCAVGETGLDFHYDSVPWVDQATAFQRQIRLAKRVGKPLVCHVRDAYPEALALLDEEKPPEAGVVMHCFTGGPGEAVACLSRGYSLSFSGIVTFPSAQNIRDALVHVPLSHVLVETDAPYLSPIPLRGKRNEPAHVVHTAETVARVRGVAFAELAGAVVANASAMFRLTDGSVRI